MNAPARKPTILAAIGVASVILGIIGALLAGGHGDPAACRQALTNRAVAGAAGAIDPDATTPPECRGLTDAELADAAEQAISDAFDQVLDQP